MNEPSTMLVSIGQKLKNAREARGFNLRQICERTKIPMNTLQSIDNGQAEGLPETVYVAGFIRRYADAVGLDGTALSDEFRRGMSDESGKNGKNGKNGAGRYPASQPVYVHPEYMAKARINTAPPRFKLWAFNFALMFLVLGIFCFLMNQTNNNSNQQDPSVLSLGNSAARQTGTPGGPGSANQTMPATNPGLITAPAVDGTKIALSANQHVWVEVKAVSSGESLYTGYLEQGDRRDFSDAQGFRVRAGNGGSLSVDYKGKIETLGSSGKVTERAFVASTPGTGAPGDPATATTAPGTKTATTGSTMTTPRIARKAPTKPRTASSYRSIESSPRSIDDSGGSRSIDVPYRYTEGRVDND